MTEPPFEAPWHAQAFALTHHLADRGVFTWPRWTATLGKTIAAHPVEDNDAYWSVWVATLERLVADDPDLAARLADLRAAWKAAYLRTPHGQPVRV